MKIALKILLLFFASINLLLAWRALFRLHQPTTVIFWIFKVVISAVSPFLFLSALIILFFGLRLHSTATIILAGLSALLFMVHIEQITRAPDKSTDFDSAFGSDWKNNIPSATKDKFLSSRYVLKLPKHSEPIFSQNISFYKIPGSNRELFCDIWQPPKDVRRSGVAFIYFHGSAWTSLDKDFGTRPFFKHLANQGHVIMDVAYRLFPETDFTGMVYDAKHAIAWMKENASAYGIDSNRIVIGGGSAGAHVALLAAYTNFNERFTPADLESKDLKVHGVISLYGQADLVATYYHTTQHLTKHSSLGPQKEGEHGGMPSWLQHKMGDNFHRLCFDKNVEPGMLSPMLGGSPDEKPESYTLFSPIIHVDHFSPPTLIIHGSHDILAPLPPIQNLYFQLKKQHVPVVMHIVPQSDHAFDLILPKFSPSAQNAIYDVERFLAIMAYNPVKRMKVYSELGTMSYFVQ
jgi:acetyl esterase/lipase